MLKQARFLSLFLLAFVMSCRPSAEIRTSATRQYIFSDSSNSLVDSSVWKMITPYRDSLNLTMNELLAYSAQPLTKGNPEGLLGNFAADACHQQALAKCMELGIPPQDFTFLNNGGLRVSLPKGAILRKNIFELMPFENELVVLSLDGNQLTELLANIAGRGGAPVSGMMMEIHDKKAVGVKIHSMAVDNTKSYRVLTSDYLAGGGDNLEFLKNIKKENLNLKVRDAMIYYLQDLQKKGDTLKVILDGRIHNN
jgi:2',3'-cyclic-nucleotide 2'-phosphodiesterase (5'-nucleotidase family)